MNSDHIIEKMESDFDFGSFDPIKILGNAKDVIFDDAINFVAKIINSQLINIKNVCFIL